LVSERKEVRPVKWFQEGGGAAVATVQGAES